VRKPDRIEFPLKCLRDLKRWLKSRGVDGVVIGGIAAGLLGTPRATHDVDVLVVIDDDTWSEFLAAAMVFGFEPRIPDPLQFARTHRVLLMVHQPSQWEVDVTFGSLEFERELIARSTTVKVGNVRVPVPTPEDLIILKAIPRRPNDLADIAELLHHHPRLDVARIRRVAADFSAFLECPEILDDVERLLLTRGKKSKG
jgi:hypothetical protein